MQLELFPEPSLGSSREGFIKSMRSVDEKTLKRWADNPLMTKLRRDVAAMILSERKTL